MKYWVRIMLIAAAGITAMVLLTVGLLAIRRLLESYGYEVTPFAFMITFLVISGAAYGTTADFVLREVRKHQAGDPKKEQNEPGANNRKQTITNGQPPRNPHE